VELLTVPAVTETGAEVDPCGTVTEAGRFAAAGDALNATVAPPLSAADVRDTVQVDPLLGVSDVGVHVIPLSAGVWRIVTVDPDALVAIFAPVESADTPLVSWTVEDESGVDPARVRVTAATTLLGIGVELMPQTRQVAVPVPLLQESDLLAAPAAGVKVADVKSVVE